MTEGYPIKEMPETEPQHDEKFIAKADAALIYYVLGLDDPTKNMRRFLEALAEYKILQLKDKGEDQAAADLARALNRNREREEKRQKLI